MAFRMFSSPASPIAISFGSSSVKVLQTSAEQQSPALLAAAELPVPDGVRLKNDELFAFYEQELGDLFGEGRFKARRAVVAVPSHQTIVQHMQLSGQGATKREDLVRGQLQLQLGIDPQSVVVRSLTVRELSRDSQSRAEVICLAMPRDLVMRHVSLLEKFRLEVIGVHTEMTAMVHAFDHITKRKDDVNLTTLYIDMGWTGTRVAIAHGQQIVFARSIPIGGRQFDERIAKVLQCDLSGARAHRLSLDDPEALRREASDQPPGPPGAGAPGSALAAGGGSARPASSPTATATADRRAGVPPPVLPEEVEGGDGPTSAATVDLSELLETINDELAMSLRYHKSLFPERQIDRTILLGGEARQRWMCRHLVRSLGLPPGRRPRLGDPLARYTGSAPTPGLDRTQPQPGWAVPCGLCAAPGNT